MSPRAKSATRPRIRRALARRGVTIVEVMTAVTVLGIGMLGLAGTASYVALQMGGGSQRTTAATIAQQKFDSLASVNCKGLASGTDSVRNVRVNWTVNDSSYAKWIKESVKFRTRRGYLTMYYQSMIACK